jgi:hypothetical protein
MTVRISKSFPSLLAFRPTRAQKYHQHDQNFSSKATYESHDLEGYLRAASQNNGN